MNGQSVNSDRLEYTLKLKYQLPESVLHALFLSETEQIQYAVPYDIDSTGNLTNDCYLIVTDLNIFVTNTYQCIKKYPLLEYEDIICEVYHNCGAFILQQNNEPEVIVRFSSKHLSRFSYIARGAMLLKQGCRDVIESDEPEKTCEVCGRVLPGTLDCPYCSHKLGFIRQLITMVSPYKLQMALILFLMLMAAAVTLLNPEVQKHLVDNILLQDQPNKLQAYLCLAFMFLLSMGIVAVNIAKSYLCAKLGSSISKDLREKLYYKIQVLSLSFINDRKPGELMNRIARDTNRVREFMENVFCNLFTVSIIFVFDIIYMLILDVKLALLAFLFTPFAFIVSIGLRKNINRRFHMQNEKEDQVSSKLQDVISGMTIVKSYGKEQDEADKFNELAISFAKIQRRNEVFFAIFFPLISFCMGSGIYLITYFGGTSVLLGNKTPGELLQFISYTSMLYMYLGWLSNFPRQLMRIINSLERINDVMNQTPKISNGLSSIEIDLKGNIELVNASFGYKSYKPVLSNINLSIKAGEMIGFVGASGTGKSTLINLIMHLYEVDQGQILIDGIDIKNIKLENYHSQIGVVLQETFLFSGTILNNIQFANPNASLEEVILAAKMANAHDFILKTPDGYNTYVGEKGFNLSGGERQRIAIARAILNQPKLLILDEATASLDTESEYLIQKALQRLTKGRTTFAIAHRLSTLKDADRLVVIDGHHVAEIGTHEQLMQQKGIYYGLVTAQLQMQATTATT